MKMKSGIEFVIEERNEQIYIHGRDVQMDFDLNGGGQLAEAARKLSVEDIGTGNSAPKEPAGWSKHIWNGLINKTYKKRCIIAAALLSAEVDRLNFILLSIDPNKSIEV